MSFPCYQERERQDERETSVTIISASAQPAPPLRLGRGPV